MYLNHHTSHTPVKKDEKVKKYGRLIIFDFETNIARNSSFKYQLRQFNESLVCHFLLLLLLLLLFLKRLLLLFDKIHCLSTGDRLVPYVFSKGCFNIVFVVILIISISLVICLSFTTHYVIHFTSTKFSLLILKALDSDEEDVGMKWGNHLCLTDEKSAVPLFSIFLVKLHCFYSHLMISTGLYFDLSCN